MVSLILLLVTEVCADVAGAQNPWMVEGNIFPLPHDLFERDRFASFSAGRHHDPVSALADQVGADGPEARRQEPVGCRWRAAALHVSEYRDAGFQTRQFQIGRASCRER